MPTVHGNKPPKVLPFRIPKEGIVGFRVLNPILFFILARLGIKVSTDGDIQEIEGGVHLKTGGGAAATPDTPFLCTGGAAPGGGVVTIAPGTFVGVPLSGSVAITGSGTEYIYLRVSYSLTASVGGYTYAASYTGGSFLAQSSLQSNPLGPQATYFYILLATYTDGSKTTQHVTHNLSAELLGTSSSKAVMTVILAG